MPFPKTWLSRHAEVLAEVRQFPAPALDRESIMRLFDLKRRAALLLMKELGPRTVGGRWYVDKKELLRWLEDCRPQAEREIDRRARWGRSMLRAGLEGPRRPSPLLIVRLSPEEVHAMAGLPAGVTLAPGRPSTLTIEFSSVMDLAEKVLKMGTALNRDLDRYVQLIEPDTETNAEEEEEIRRERDYYLNWRPGDP